jgi:hypothetical protein
MMMMNQTFDAGNAMGGAASMKLMGGMSSSEGAPPAMCSKCTFSPLKKEGEKKN